VEQLSLRFSLALCTYNRACLLKEALNSLSSCHTPNDQWELLLVDNNSRDDTRSVAESFSDRLPLLYVFEPVQGLSAARNRALRECQGDVLLFTDDDLTFEPDWLRNYEKAFREKRDAGWFGGRILPRWGNKRPSWLRDESMALIAGLVVRYDLGERDRYYNDSDPTPFGASFAIRRQAFERIGRFRTDLGVRGDVPGRGEEAEYFQRLKNARIQGFYVGSAGAHHWQDRARFRWHYLYRYGIQKGLAQKRMGILPTTSNGSRSLQLRYGFKGVWQLLKGRGDRARQCVINMGIQKGLRTSEELRLASGTKSF
jgi:glycosyltransferase involved in cell wall biosynthesis